MFIKLSVNNYFQQQHLKTKLTSNHGYYFEREDDEDNPSLCQKQISPATINCFYYFFLRFFSSEGGFLLFSLTPKLSLPQSNSIVSRFLLTDVFNIPNIIIINTSTLQCSCLTVTQPMNSPFPSKGTQGTPNSRDK